MGRELKGRLRARVAILARLLARLDPPPTRDPPDAPAQVPEDPTEPGAFFSPWFG